MGEMAEAHRFPGKPDGDAEEPARDAVAAFAPAEEIAVHRLVHEAEMDGLGDGRERDERGDADRVYVE